ncbi:hypothetical protein OQA88_11902 [Cercophora sp. LCS_1]
MSVSSAPTGFVNADVDPLADQATSSGDAQTSDAIAVAAPASSSAGSRPVLPVPAELRLQIYKMAIEPANCTVLERTGLFERKITDQEEMRVLKELVRLAGVSRAMRDEILEEFRNHCAVYFYSEYKALPTGVRGTHWGHGPIVRRYGMPTARESFNIIRGIMACPILPSCIRHVSWTWTGKDNQDETAVMQYIGALPQLQSLDLVIEDPVLFRRDVSTLGGARLRSPNMRDMDIDLTNDGQAAEQHGLMAVWLEVGNADLTKLRRLRI